VTSRGEGGTGPRAPAPEALTLVHTNTVFKLGCGMFVEECRLAARDYPDVTVDEVIVDTFAMRLIRDRMPDIRGTARTEEMTSAIVEWIERES
jgi:isocitrate/isopropylmalate dehydrogenase